MEDVFRLLRFVRPYRRLAILALVLLVLQVFMDLSIPRLTQRIIDQGIMMNDQQVVVRTAILMLVISLLQVLVAVGNNNTSIQVGEGAARDLRDSLFLKIQNYSYGNLDRQSTGRLLVRLTSDIAALRQLTQSTLRIGTRAPLLMIGSLILMFNTDKGLALTMLPLLAVTSTLLVVFISQTEPLFMTVQQKLDRLNTVLQENIAGVRLVKAFVRGDFEGGRFERANEDVTARSVRVMRFMSTMSPALTMCVNIGVVVVIWVGGLQSINGSVTVGQIVAFTNYLMTTMQPLIMMTMLANTWASGIASAKRVDEIFATVPEVQDEAEALELPADVRGRIAFHNVTFRYDPDSPQPVLEDINLTVEAGQTVAILGATGSGKSTLINLVPRFYDPDAGAITIDGIDIRQVKQDSLLALIGIVPQESVLFSGTVRDNIRYGQPDATDEEVIAAARAAQAHDFVMAMSQGYDTHVEQRGSNFSGGQKQRMAIARALLLRPKILILDDATSSVDVETETRIQDAITDLLGSCGDCTSLVVAQRISTVLKADKIVVLDRGRIVAEGTHRELLRSSAIYQEIYDSQLGAGSRAEPVTAQAELELEGSSLAPVPQTAILADPPPPNGHAADREGKTQP
jgi:ATP-binding cassette, subfamily B, multidrug efflux pump